MLPFGSVVEAVARNRDLVNVDAGVVVTDTEVSPRVLLLESHVTETRMSTRSFMSCLVTIIDTLDTSKPAFGVHRSININIHIIRPHESMTSNTCICIQISCLYY